MKESMTMNLWTRKSGGSGNGDESTVTTASPNHAAAMAPERFAPRANHLRIKPVSPPVTNWNPPAPPPENAGRNVNIQAINESVAQTSGWVRPLQQEMSRVIVGQQHLIDRLLVGLVGNGHLLLEGVPGLAKTLSLKTLAAATHVKFQRLQFTPDMLPADIVGTMIYNPRDGSFHTKHGPVFSNLILADEINRAPAKVQSALLEAMQERQVTLGEETYKLPDPFLVMATQNPLEHEGTYPLPEAQVDRFMLKIIVDYPNRTEERAILDTMATTEPVLDVTPVVSAEDIIRARRVVNTIYIDDKVKDYIVDMVLATRDPQAYGVDLNGYIQNGASPRATINLTVAARASAFLQGRGYVTPQDVKNLALDVLRHRVTVSYEAEAENITAEDIIQKILETLPVP
jgi:MoxR-like ATPase